MSIVDLKSAFRKTYLSKRQAINLSDRLAALHQVKEYLITLPYFIESNHIACYLAVNDELDTSKIITAIWQAKKHCYLPIIEQEPDAPYAKSLRFVRYEEGDELMLNRYAIREPVKQNERIEAEDLDLVLAPLIAFDLEGNRLGTGGGYYDRTFAFLNNDKFKRQPFFCGLSFSIQQAEHIPHDEWDIRLQGVLTEKGYVACR